MLAFLVTSLWPERVLKISVGSSVADMVPFYVGFSVSIVQIRVACENERQVTLLDQNVSGGENACCTARKAQYGCICLSISVIDVFQGSGGASLRSIVIRCKTRKLDQCGVVKYGLVPAYVRQNTDDIHCHFVG